MRQQSIYLKLFSFSYRISAQSYSHLNSECARVTHYQQTCCHALWGKTSPFTLEQTKQEPVIIPLQTNRLINHRTD